MDVIDILEMIDSEELGEEKQVISRSYLRDVQDPFQLLNENEFTRRYRFSKDSVLILLDINFSQVKQNFFDVDGFPSVIRAIDCTHVPIHFFMGDGFI
uniref:uncharacterized protein LOC120326725 n=1 Tax=Styela clava TaxID=7725 RepID=UPI001939A144|nr:uncharacterized protein LOC120326725 [Styela clava]